MFNTPTDTPTSLIQFAWKCTTPMCLATYASCHVLRFSSPSQLEVIHHIQCQPCLLWTHYDASTRSDQDRMSWREMAGRSVSVCCTILVGLMSACSSASSSCTSCTGRDTANACMYVCVLCKLNDVPGLLSELGFASQVACAPASATAICAARCTCTHHNAAAPHTPARAAFQNTTVGQTHQQTATLAS